MFGGFALGLNTNISPHHSAGPASSMHQLRQTSPQPVVCPLKSNGILYYVPFLTVGLAIHANLRLFNRTPDLILLPKRVLFLGSVGGVSPEVPVPSPKEPHNTI